MFPARVVEPAANSRRLEACSNEHRHPQGAGVAPRWLYRPELSVDERLVVKLECRRENGNRLSSGAATGQNDANHATASMRRY